MISSGSSWPGSPFLRQHPKELLLFCRKESFRSDGSSLVLCNPMPALYLKRMESHLQSCCWRAGAERELALLLKKKKSPGTHPNRNELVKERGEMDEAVPFQKQARPGSGARPAHTPQSSKQLKCSTVTRSLSAPSPAASWAGFISPGK